MYVIKSPKRCLETYCFCSVSYYFYYYYSSPFFLCDMNVCTADLGNYWTEFHESWWSYQASTLTFVRLSDTSEN